MGYGTYTAKERIERNGRLIAFAGEVMTMDEAIARGIAEDESSAVPEKPKTQKEELLEEAADLGIDVPKKATIPDIEDLIAAAKEGTSESTDSPDDTQDGEA